MMLGLALGGAVDGARDAYNTIKDNRRADASDRRAQVAADRATEVYNKETKLGTDLGSNFASTMASDAANHLNPDTLGPPPPAPDAPPPMAGIPLPGGAPIPGVTPTGGGQADGQWDTFHKNFLAPAEGGYAADDGNGHAVNFGVNQGSNPGVDVRHLTREGAAQILKAKYWDASGSDKLAPGLAEVNGDTAVNMGLGAAQMLLQQSGGDASKYLDLREQRYRTIAIRPDKAQFLPGWLSRNDNLRSYVAGAGAPAAPQGGPTTDPAAATTDAAAPAATGGPPAAADTAGPPPAPSQAVAQITAALPKDDQAKLQPTAADPIGIAALRPLPDTYGKAAVLLFNAGHVDEGMKYQDMYYKAKAGALADHVGLLEASNDVPGMQKFVRGFGVNASMTEGKDGQIAMQVAGSPPVVYKNIHDMGGHMVALIQGDIKGSVDMWSKSAEDTDKHNLSLSEQAVHAATGRSLDTNATVATTKLPGEVAKTAADTVETAARGDYYKSAALAAGQPSAADAAWNVRTTNNPDGTQTQRRSNKAGDSQSIIGGQWINDTDAAKLDPKALAAIQKQGLRAVPLINGKVFYAYGNTPDPYPTPEAALAAAHAAAADATHQAPVAAAPVSGMQLAAARKPSAATGPAPAPATVPVGLPVSKQAQLEAVAAARQAAALQATRRAFDPRAQRAGVIAAMKAYTPPVTAAVGD
jgi:hypothetical protein